MASTRDGFVWDMHILLQMNSSKYYFWAAGRFCATSADSGVECFHTCRNYVHKMSSVFPWSLKEHTQPWWGTEKKSSALCILSFSSLVPPMQMCTWIFLLSSLRSGLIWVFKTRSFPTHAYRYVARLALLLKLDLDMSLKMCRTPASEIECCIFCQKYARSCWHWT